MVSKDFGDSILMALEVDAQEGNHALDELLHKCLAVPQRHAQHVFLVVRLDISREVLEALGQFHHMPKSRFRVLEIVLRKLTHKRRKLDVEHLTKERDKMLTTRFLIDDKNGFPYFGVRCECRLRQHWM